jgi:hypothetical protein
LNNIKDKSLNEDDFQTNSIIISVKNQIEDLVKFLSAKQLDTHSRKFNFYSSSLLIIYDNAFDGPAPVVRMIDLQHVFEKKPGSLVEHDDDGVLYGLNEFLKLVEML